MSPDSLDRRRFLKSAAAGALCAAAPDLAVKNPETGKRPVITRPLGKTGLTLPVVSMGVMNADNPALVTAALDAGIVHFDTAHRYQGGRNEEMLGQVFKGRPRHSIVVATKVPPTLSLSQDADAVPDEEPSRTRTVEDFMARLDTSLKRLKMEHVDILYLHNVSSRETALHPFFLEALERAKKSGRTRLVGLSTHKNEPEVLSAAVESKFYEVVLVAYNFKQDHVLQVRDGIAKAAAAGLGIVGMKTFAGGWLDKERTMPVNTKAALKWVLKDPHVHTVIPGFTTFDQLEEDLAVMADPVLSTEEEKDLRLAAAEPGLYCQGCESCLAGCSRHLPLPELMRSYMYVYGYRNPGRAREVVGALGLPDDPCAGCAGCSARCARGFDLRARVRDIARLASVPEEFLA